MDLGRKGISRVILILTSFLHCPLLRHLPPPLRLDLLRQVVLQMTSSLMMDRRKMGQIVYSHTSSADSWSLFISNHTPFEPSLHSLSTCSAGEEDCRRKAVARPNSIWMHAVEWWWGDKKIFRSPFSTSCNGSLICIVWA